MPDDLTKKRPLDVSKINIHEAWERKYWSKKFGIQVQDLENAVKKVGPSVSKVKNLINKK